MNTKKRRMTSKLLILLSITFYAGTLLAASPADCQAYAQRVQADSGSVAGSMGRGAMRGAAFGAIVGDSSSAARKGAALGAISSGVRSSSYKNEVYKRAYDDCMAGRVRY